MNANLNSIREHSLVTCATVVRIQQELKQNSTNTTRAPTVRMRFSSGCLHQNLYLRIAHKNDSEDAAQIGLKRIIYFVQKSRNYFLFIWNFQRPIKTNNGWDLGSMIHMQNKESHRSDDKIIKIALLCDSSRRAHGIHVYGWSFE